MTQIKNEYGSCLNSGMKLLMGMDAYHRDGWPRPNLEIA
jgi:hypothetical protein